MMQIPTDISVQKSSYIDMLETVIKAADEYFSACKDLMVAILGRADNDRINKLYGNYQDSQQTYQILLRETNGYRLKYSPYSLVGAIQEWRLDMISQVGARNTLFELDIKMILEAATVDIQHSPFGGKRVALTMETVE